MKQMYFILIGLFLIILSGQAQTQERLPYKTKAMFKTDTLRYLEYNFTERSSLYKGKKIADVLKDIDLPVIYVRSSTNFNGPKNVRSLSFAVRQVGDKQSELKDYYIEVFFVNPPSWEKYKEASGYSRENPHVTLTPQLYDFIKDLEVSSVRSNLYIRMKRENEIKKATDQSKEKK
ncbi:hypothetical protein FACS189451_12230 [Bacteroidia bacterium]|nr:hypothetical protein FACS189451_12230 [Bacteroidia bacterium]